ncbi:MAG: nucleotide-binding protein, partial [Chloroflexi bacterium]|nr:nucleotide-binding protein [Chloroflexota bacterium]
VILEEEPSRGRTIIEKLEENADASLAVVLMTGDDVGGTAGTALEDMRPRARQNVVLELGYFMARLGRNRVAVLHQPDTEIPTNYSGVIFIPIDGAGAWKMLLARELRSAGLPIDMNKAV